eukprot:1144971-Pelagomonas_calceolata.AAC.1
MLHITERDLTLWGARYYRLHNQHSSQYHVYALIAIRKPVRPCYTQKKKYPAKMNGSKAQGTTCVDLNWLPRK